MEVRAACAWLGGVRRRLSFLRGPPSRWVMRCGRARRGFRAAGCPGQAATVGEDLGRHV